MVFRTFAESLAQYDTYPSNLLHPAAENYELDCYRDRLRAREDSLFCTNPAEVSVDLLQWDVDARRKCLLALGRERK